jgi:RimJ/RimL family protein N-acetyltransferase
MEPSKQILETKRLRLREFTLEDTAFILDLLNSPGWLRYIGDRGVKTEEQAKNYLLNGPIKSYTKNGYGLSMVERKDDNKPIGMCGIIKRDTLENPDIGFAFYLNSREKDMLLRSQRQH